MSNKNRQDITINGVDHLGNEVSEDVSIEYGPDGKTIIEKDVDAKENS